MIRTLQRRSLCGREGSSGPGSAPRRAAAVWTAPTAILPLAALLLLAGCAGAFQTQAAREAALRDQRIQELSAQGRFEEAREIWKGVARSRRGTPSGEEAAYRAALLLVHPGNPSPDYRQAAREFSAVAAEYPQGARAVDAGAWQSALSRQEASQVAELIERSAALSRKLEETAAAFAAAGKERLALVREGEELRSRIGQLVQERDRLIGEHAALARERDALARDKSGLEKDLRAMTKDRDRLHAAKKKLEQRLRDVTEVDIRMEKKRRNITK